MTCPKNKRSITGILLLDKPQGISSNTALNITKRLFHASKAGHTGSLDPLATGMLPLCFGQATKFSQFLIDTDKCYRVTAQLGVRTATGDAEGEIIAEHTVPELNYTALNSVLDEFRGEIEQTPPMYSALKHKGQPLYKLARQGITIERAKRKITIYRCDVLDIQNNQITLEIHCSKGTYIRTLIDDLGELLGCGGHILKLHRLWVGPYRTVPMWQLDDLKKLVESDGESIDFAALDRYLLSVESAFTNSVWPKVTVDDEEMVALQQGKILSVLTSLPLGWVHVYHTAGPFVGMAEIVETGKMNPRCILR